MVLLLDVGVGTNSRRTSPEFIRDMIADLNGIYYLVSMNENLVRRKQ